MSRDETELDYMQSRAFWRDRAVRAESGLRATALCDNAPSLATEWTSAKLFARRMRMFRANGPFERVLDVGCGDGRWSSALAEIANEVIAVDFCEDFVAATRERALADGRTNVVASVQDVRDLRVQGPCDLVTLGAVTMYIEDADLERLIQRLRAELVNPGGLVYLRTTTHARGSRSRGPYQAIYRPIEMYRKLFEANRFVVIEQRLVPEYSHAELLSAYFKIARIATLGATRRWARLERALFHTIRWSSPLTVHGMFALARCFGTRILARRSYELVVVNRDRTRLAAPELRMLTTAPEQE